jgi:hypothetical protein
LFYNYSVWVSIYGLWEYNSYLNNENEEGNRFSEM